MNGILIIDKPSGITSHDGVQEAGRILGVKKVGHSGTLDPMATGVLVLCVGRATRLASFLQTDDKEYIAEMRLGLLTDTYDSSGKIVTRRKCLLSKDEIKEVLFTFKGVVTQIPPSASAIKIGGKPSYRLAREGKRVEARPRRIEIFDIELLGVGDNKGSLDAKGGDQIVVFRVVCSKGTYIRTLCFDVGNVLGCGACMGRLTRTRCGVFSLDRATTLKQLAEYKSQNRLKEIFVSMSEALQNYPAVMIEKQAVFSIGNGAFLRPSMIKEEQGDIKKGKIVRLLDEENNLLAVARMVEKFSTPCRSNKVIGKSLCVVSSS